MRRALGWCGLLVIVSLGLVRTGPPIQAQQDVLVGPPGSEGFGLHVIPLPNGNLVVTDPGYDHNQVVNVGAVYLYDGASLQLISSLRGSQAYDQVGESGIVTLPNGNFVILSPYWDQDGIENVGAITWASGTQGITGVVSIDNSLVGSQGGEIGFWAESVTVLPGGNYLVGTGGWDNGPIENVGAVTWGDGMQGVRGPISAANSLIGTSANDGVGGVYMLSNGNYVVTHPFWDDGAIPDVGAVTWGDGQHGIVGEVSPANSLIGTHAYNEVGTTVVALANGNYVVRSPNWDRDSVVNVGAVTWVDGTRPSSDVVGMHNSLIGTTAGDTIGGDGVIALPNGHYVVGSSRWDAGPAANAGAVTWADGTHPTMGVVSSANSLVGSTQDDFIGRTGDHGEWGIVILGQGNIVIHSPYWDAGTLPNVGAVTWMSGSRPTVGPISATTSLIGDRANLRVGAGRVHPLTNGHYLVYSPWWSEVGVPWQGALTWGNGETGTRGVVSSANSRLGMVTDELIIGSIVPLTNGHYVLSNVYWDSPEGANVGLVTWGSGTGPTTGTVSVANSLVGTSADDAVCGDGIVVLPDGRYLVRSFSWKPTPLWHGGALTWGTGGSVQAGPVSSTNSLIGDVNHSFLSSTSPPVLADGSYVIVGSVGSEGFLSWQRGIGGVIGRDLPAASLSLPAAVWMVYDPVADRLVLGLPMLNRIMFYRVARPSRTTVFLPQVRR